MSLISSLFGKLSLLFHFGEIQKNIYRLSQAHSWVMHWSSKCGFFFFNYIFRTETALTTGVNRNITLKIREGILTHAKFTRINQIFYIVFHTMKALYCNLLPLYFQQIAGLAQLLLKLARLKFVEAKCLHGNKTHDIIHKKCKLHGQNLKTFSWKSVIEKWIKIQSIHVAPQIVFI